MSQSSQIRPGRNDPCSCGSGKKYKSCCAQTESQFGRRPQADLQVQWQQAQQAVARGDFGEAEHWFRRLCESRPNDAAAHAGLGQALCWQSRRREGVSRLTQAARLLERQSGKTRDAKFLVELSEQMLHWGSAEKAERLARLAVKAAPDSPMALNSLVLCLARVNRDAEALPLARRVCEMLPNVPGCQNMLAIIEFRRGHADAALSRLEGVIDGNLEPEQTARAWLEKGVVLDKLGRFAEAFAAFTRAAEAHAGLARHRAVDGERLFKTLARNKAGFTHELLHRWSLSELIGDGLPAPMFLMGFLRSGTTLTEQVLGAHPGLLTTDESGVVHELAVELERISGVAGDQPGALESLSIQQVLHLRQFYWRRLREEFGEEVMGKPIVDKNALNTIDLGLVAVVFPEARILFALRDPRDICLSCYMQAFSLSPATVNLLTWEGIAWQYAAVMDFWLTLRDTMQPRFLELRYEDTVGDFETTYRRVFEFLGLPWAPGVARFHERAKGRYIATPSFAAVSQPLYRSSVARWHSYGDAFEATLPMLEPFIERFGYAL